MGERATPRGLVVVSSIGCALAFAVALNAILPFHYALLLAAVAAWYALPGVVFAARAASPGSGRIFVLAIGTVIGYAASSLALLALWVAGLRSGPVLLAVPPLLSAAALVALARRGSLALPRSSPGDLPAVLVLLLLVPLVVGRPFSRVGELTPDGRAYRAYFTADFVWRMAVTAEVAKGEVPPRNQFFRGDDLRYYWLPDLLPAVEYRTVGRNLRLEQVLLVHALAIDVMFVAFLYTFVRHWTTSSGAAFAGAAAGLFLGSFEGTERLIAFAREGTGYEHLRMLNIDAITRWIYGSLPVDGLQRVLFWQPQHAMGYALGYAALLAVSARDELPPLRAIALAGALLAAALFFSSFAAIMLGTIVGIVTTARLAWAGRWKTMAAGAAAAAAPIAAAAIVALRLHYVDRGESLVRVLVNPAAVTRPWLSIFLSFGPLLIGAAVGTWLGFRKGAARRVAPLWIAIAVAFFFYFFVDVKDHQYVYVGWRAGHLLFVVFAALTALALQELWRLGPATRRVTSAAALILAAAAAPTLAIDIYNAQDTANRAPGPRFRWTVILTPDELAALEWIRRYTPETAIVQVEPHVRDADTWAYIPTFAERRMAAGLPISMVPLDKYQAASARVLDLYRATDAGEARRRAIELGIEYLVVGPPERSAYPALERTLDGRPEDFRPVFRNRSMTIYFVERDRAEVAGRR